MVNYQSEFVQRCLTDTGFLARHVLGMNYSKVRDANGVLVEKRPGGILASGPHQKMVELLDSPTTQKIMEAPRGSFKTSLLHAWIIRLILVNPNIRIFYASDVYANALKTIDAIKSYFERCGPLREIFGDYVGDNWRRESLTVSKRTKFLKDPTLSCFATDKDVTGGHCDVMIWDDIVTDKNSRTVEGVQKAIGIFEAAQPLLDPGCIQVINGTRYVDDDLLGHVERNLSDHFEKLILDAGVDLVNDERGGFQLVGEPSFEHLDKPFLQKYLSIMGPKRFSAQYLNRCLATGMSIFDRRQFRTIRWEDGMEHLACYILTDSAVSEREDGCYSVIALVGLDAVNNAYVMDVRVGHMAPADFRKELFSVIERWQPRVQIRSVLMETIAMNRVFKSMIEEEARKRQMRVNLVDVMRGSSSQSKEQRIQGLQGRFADGKIYFMDTIPKTFNDLGTTKVLFDPNGMKTEDGKTLPDGEIVLEFVRFPVHGKRDIADALADIEAVDKAGDRLCQPQSRTSLKKHDAMRKRAGLVIPIPMMVNGREQLVNIVPTSNPTSDGFWKNTYDRLPANARRA